MSNKDLVMHKLRGEHDFTEAQMTSPQVGQYVSVQKCKICGYEKKVVTNNDFYGTSTYANYSTSPWGSSFTMPVTSSGIQTVGTSSIPLKSSVSAWWNGT